MVYKWCLVPQCPNTSLKNPEKLFVSVPRNPKRRKMWLNLARRVPNISSQSCVYMCEDHFDIEKDSTNYMKYKMGFTQKIILTEEAVPTRFHCQEDRRSRSCDFKPSREVFLRRQRADLVTECLLSQNATETHAESIQIKENLNQVVIQPEELPKNQEKETIIDPIITVEKSVQVKKVKMHYRSKAVQTRWPHKSVCTSLMKPSTTSRFTSPFKIELCCLQPSKSGVIKAVKRNIFLEDEKSDSDIYILLNAFI